LIIPKKSVTNVSIAGDGNCWYRTISAFLTGDQEHYKIIRKLIYDSAKSNKEKFAHFS
jgi:hypothetical protein